MNEADVRGEILDPLLRRLGYAMTGEATIRREHHLVYPFLYLGRKKPGKDLRLQGNADYTLEVAGHARWTLEAKSPAAALDDDVLQQAWSYAIHPEVQSTYFAICNGKHFLLFATSSAWGSNPLVSCTYAELDSRFDEVKAFLGPSQIARRHPNHLTHAGRPLGPNLRAFERVASGAISYEKSSLPVPLLSQLQVAIVDGSIRRDSTGKIQAQLLTRGPFRDMQSHLEGLGLQVQTYVTDDDQLSVSPAAPTVFLYEADELFPFAMNHETFEVQLLDTPMRVLIRAKAIGHFESDRFSGTFTAEMTFHTAGGTFPARGEGTFELRLS